MATTGTISIGNDTAYLTLVTGQSSVTDGATEVVTVDCDRAQLVLVNHSTDKTVYFGVSTSLTTTNGVGFLPTSSYRWPYAGPLYGIVSAGTAVVSYGKLER